MGKGSKQRPTAETFWSNWDAVFGEKPAIKDYECFKCGQLDSDEVNQVVEVNHEDYGDQVVERLMYTHTCAECGSEVEPNH